MSALILCNNALRYAWSPSRFSAPLNQFHQHFAYGIYMANRPVSVDDLDQTSRPSRRTRKQVSPAMRDAYQVMVADKRLVLFP